MLHRIGGRPNGAKAAARARPREYGAAAILLWGLCPGAGNAQTAAAAPVATKPNTAQSEAADAAEEAQDEILVTAHRQRGAVATDIPPEVSLTPAAIRALGAVDLKEVFDDLAPELKGGGSEAGQTTAMPIVLVNGQRIAGFSSIQSFPPESVLRLEVFPEQVALQYGYGADQRVVNIVLRANYRALQLLGRYTLAPDNFRGVYRAKVDLVRIGEDSHWNIDLDYSHQDPILAGTTLVGPPTVIADGAKVPAHSLATQTDELIISGATTRTLGKVNAELTGRLDLDAMQSRPGLSDEDGDLLADEGLSNLVSGPFGRVDRTVDAQANLTLNGRFDAWRWSFIGRLDDMTRVTRTDPLSGGAGLDAILLPSPGLLGYRCDRAGNTDCVSTTVRTAGGDFYLNGDLFALPAGAVTTALRTGFAFSGIRSDSPITPTQADRDRAEGNVQANLNFPITARDSPVGKLTTGVNGTLRQLSDFRTLSTIGSTLDWSPIKPIDFLATFSREQQAPSLIQLDQATLDTPDLRAFDFVQGNTALVDRIEGGNADLRRATSRVTHLRLQVSPLRTGDLALSAEYTIERTRNPIASLTAATSATMAALPDRFARSANGYLTALDVSPVNLARRDRQQVRWGINYSTAFGSAQPVTASDGSAKPPVRSQFQIALYDTWRFQDDVVLRQGLPGIDLLGHDTISDGGGTPANEVELQTTLATAKWSADVNAVWQTRTTAYAGPLQDDRLTFSQGIRLNLRLQINLNEQHWLTRRLPFLRGSLNLSADNLLGAHTRVRDSSGAVPAAYDASYINPTGRTFRITLRKRFR